MPKAPKENQASVKEGSSAPQAPSKAPQGTPQALQGGLQGKADPASSVSQKAPKGKPCPHCGMPNGGNYLTHLKAKHPDDLPQSGLFLTRSPRASSITHRFTLRAEGAGGLRWTGLGRLSDTDRNWGGLPASTSCRGASHRVLSSYGRTR